MSRPAEWASHANIKHRVVVALEPAIPRAGAEAHTLPDGFTLRIDDRTAIEPDALVYGGPELPDDAIVAPSPVIATEVLSLGTARTDLSRKLAGYFKEPGNRHYLIVDGRARSITHHWRRTDGSDAVAIVPDGSIIFDPSGLSIALTAIFPPAKAGRALTCRSCRT